MHPALFYFIFLLKSSAPYLKKKHMIYYLFENNTISETQTLNLVALLVCYQLSYNMELLSND